MTSRVPCLWIFALAVGFAVLARAEPTVALPGSVRPFPPGAVLSSASKDAVLPLVMTLRMRDFTDLQARVGRGELVSRAELESRYLPLQGDYTAAVAWLAAQGFEIVGADPGRLGVFVRGTVGQVEASFGVTISSVRIAGEEHLSAIDAPQVPARLAPAVLGIGGLQPLRARQPHLRETLANNAPAYFPREILKAYNGDALAVTGAGETIVVVIDSPPSAADLTQFWSAVGVNQSLDNYSFVQVNGGTPGAPTPEATLDAEWTSGIAPGAKLRVYCAGALDDVSLDRTFGRILADLPANPSIHQLSISLGGGETFTSSAQMDADAQYFAALASQGVSIFVSSGDGGSTPDDLSTGAGNTGPLQVENYASDPSVTAVGGSSLTLEAGSGERTSETAWAYSGGGASIHFARPAWQSVTGAARLVPDVCAAANPSRGAYVVFGGAAKMYGGTSWGAPVWAGICALINQGRALAGKPPAGLLNPSLYPLAGSDRFYDVTVGSNAGGAHSAGNYATGAGYDPVTGLGAPNIANLFASLTAPDPAPEGVVISQVYGGGGLANAPFKNDFIELYNRGPAAVSLDAYTVQHTGRTGNSWLKTQLTGTIQPKAYYLIKEAGNTAVGAGAALPAADCAGVIDLNATEGKVALVNSRTTIPTGISNPIGDSYGVVDFLGYGAANAAEGSGPAAALSVTLSAQRAGAGDIDTDNNAADFTAAAPAPRNASTRANAPDLTLSLTHTGAFKQADASDVCIVTVSNAGVAATNGAVSVFAAPPAGLTVTSLTGSGWTAAADQQSATRSDPLAGGASYPPLSMTVRVDPDAPSTVTNLARVLGGGELNTANDTASDSIAITALTASEAWRYHYFGSTANSGPAADDAIASGDGLPNLLKYALGLDPKTPAVNGVKADLQGGRLRLSVSKNPSATDVIFSAEITADLRVPSSWSGSGVVYDVNSATSFQAHDGSGAGRYMRLKITRP